MTEERWFCGTPWHEARWRESKQNSSQHPVSNLIIAQPVQPSTKFKLAPSRKTWVSYHEGIRALSTTFYNVLLVKNYEHWVAVFDMQLISAHCSSYHMMDMGELPH
ncbi:hypothetical protein FOTG_03594 [Fusarium oxysporum f. sp. vasinfectum 25433]|jgi:hypothetical protein|uniref:Uncharacterized protein n=1 Tax=Fusarium oxysporum f. sp. vasinfectum 25433 TaxID=1089449 RepID=X0MEJ1_FUSOX|nr:hypothetical protein FOTG_03594 [Fusarium oxysporum f. sp. vasinfectum 25433]EXM31948.1 hypothetical protein FOTG_03594 [Fusarium oxysporum f. sp. vasinfectum 25433]